MTKEEIFDKIADIIADRFEVDKATISIDFVEFVLELEDTFGSEISDEDAEKLSTVGEVVDYVAAHQAK